jgi:plastocyanin
MLMRPSLALLIMFAACSDSGSKTPDAANGADAAASPDATTNPDAMALPDAAVIPDAAVATVMAVTCPSGAVPTITTVDNVNAYMPSSVTITVGQIVKFMMSSSHNVVPDPPMPTDAGLMVGLGETKCLKFTKAGTFWFKCMPHGFEGTAIVQ